MVYPGTVNTSQLWKFFENHHRLKSTGPFKTYGDIGSFLGGYLVRWVDPHLQGHELFTFEPFQLG